MKLDVISLPVRQGLLVRLPSDDSTIRSDDSDSRRRSSIFFSHSAQAPLPLFVSLPGFQRFDDGRLLLLLFAFQLSCLRVRAAVLFPADDPAFLNIFLGLPSVVGSVVLASSAGLLGVPSSSARAFSSESLWFHEGPVSFHLLLASCA